MARCWGDAEFQEKRRIKNAAKCRPPEMDRSLGVILLNSFFTPATGGPIGHSEVSERPMPDMQDPDFLAGFIHFVENAIGVFPIAKEKASDLALRFSGFTSEGTPIRKLFGRIQAINEFGLAVDCEHDRVPLPRICSRNSLTASLP